MGMFHYYELPNSEMFVFDEFLICQIKEGAEIKPELNERLNKIIQNHFEGKNIVYISNRVNSYSVDPLTYSETEKIPNLVAIAIVPNTQLMRKNAEFESEFFHKPYEIFDTLSEAIQWVHKIIEAESK
ncbi:hypothetical protein [Winogradskyella sp. UBA3174]|uniref:hypothetical protein n=1 Tax=Winogradskyella sp. UBA3174 TaxID=1947785 RepID=UPI0025FE5563|nr:hypothetical protein [Winogradskyella sp. UBA3174]|tara:strand:- start:13467 stop:13850 length:384 start_codon:yes stop_codon:yes gene_type:complete